MALERVIEVDLLVEDDIRGASELLLNESAGDGGILLSRLLLIEALISGKYWMARTAAWLRASLR